MTANPYADLRALVDCTRELDPEEVAELQLEQGYADRALAIYEGLLAKAPDNVHYRRRRDWLARMATVRQRPVRLVAVGEAPPEPAPAVAPPLRRVSPDVTLRGVVAPRSRVETRRGPQAAPTDAAAGVRRLSIVGVGRS